MVLDPLTHTLFIFAGQRDDKYLSDMYAYDITTNTVSELFGNFSASGGPDACFTQRAVVDPKLKEVYVCVDFSCARVGGKSLIRWRVIRFCGLTRAQQSSALTVLRSDAPNWVYQYVNPSQPGKWTQILPEVFSETLLGGHGRGESESVPLPRYAHQVVYDERTKKVYMHGGNAGEGRGLGGEEKERGARGGEAEGGGGEGTGAGAGNWVQGGGEERSRSGLRETRLDDFWMMDLVR